MDNVAPPIEISIPRDGPDYGAGARLLAVLAHPPISGTDTRWRMAERALGYLFAVAQETRSPGWLDRHQHIIPSHLTIGAKLADQELNRIIRASHHRMGAAHVLNRLLSQALHDGRDGAPRRRRRMTVERAIDGMLESEAERQEQLEARGHQEPPRFENITGNFKNRALRTTMPVIHLAIAVAHFIDRSQRELATSPHGLTGNWPQDVGGPQASFAHILSSRTVALALVERAGEIAEMLQHLKSRRPKPGSLVRFHVE